MHRFSINRLDLPIIVPAILIVLLSLSAFYSIDFGIFRQQLIFLFISLIAYVIFLNVDYRVFGVYARYLYYIMIALLLLLFVIGIEARGAVRWVDVFGIRIQFSEIIKPFFIIVMASYLTSNKDRSFAKFLKSLLILLPIFILTLRQPDLGNAVIYFLLVVFMLFMYGFPLRYFFLMGISILVPLPTFYNLLLDYQKQRILSFINPTVDPVGSSYNTIQSLISIGSGGFLGKGFGDATQSILKFLPERHTDFIFATISENLGFLGAVFLLCLYGYLLYRIYKIREVVRDRFSEMLLVGFYFIFLIHIFLNIGMNIGIVPVVGITLPFASYGGSSLLTSFIILGIISSIKYDFNKRTALEIT